MCAINGFNFRDQELILKMNEATRHRGPNDRGIFLDDGVSFGHQRLSIIDLSDGGHQPMATPDGRYSIVFNGEIYNFQEIRNELEKKGHVFRSHSDTEVLLHAFAEYGDACVKKLNGIFAFAIWDKVKKELFLARDHVGVKPLYYYHDGAKFIFSSEVKAILKHSINRAIDTDALNIYFRFLYVPAPLTMWKHIKKFPQGHYGTVRNGSLTLKQFWRLERGVSIDSYRDAKIAIKNGLTKAVQRQLVSDKPIGIFLSGGTDSTALLSLMYDEVKYPIQTFSVGFESPVQGERYNADLNLARESARYFGTNHHEIVISGKDIRDTFEKVIYHMDEPISNAIQGTTYLLAQFAKKYVDVVFGGDGGDELFGGYDRYWYSSRIDIIRKLPWFLRSPRILNGIGNIIGKPSLFEKVQSTGFDRFISFMAQKEHIVSQFLKPSVMRGNAVKNAYSPYFKDVVDNDDFTNQLMQVDAQTWLPDESLVRSDKLTMAHGLEERVPILDYELVELAMRIPSRFKLDTKEKGKRVLRDAIKESIPPFIFNQKKRGWFSPASKWLRGDMREFAETVLSPDYCVDTKEFFDFKAVRGILNDHIEHRTYALNTIWSLMTFQVWYKTFMKSR
ncbi:MAG: asparagine synthase (glutamine-hydrolyzing) [bacterium]|nr:asparagine synthase (glutamine-hydrolyzing) [bacterium]